jgi:DNA-binding MarR family transcriptional regulator
MTKTISRLQAQGFVSKTDSTKDARQAHIFLTEAGKQAILGIEKAVRKTEKRALGDFDKKDRKALAKFLKRIEANLSGGAKKGSVETEIDDDDALDQSQMTS